MNTPPKKLTVLVVDDEKDFCEYLRCVFEDSFENILIDEAYESRSALLKIKEHKYHLLITDLRMPGDDGRKLIQSISMLPENQHPHYILLLSGLLVIDNGPYLALKKVNYMSKPISKDEINNFIQKVVASIKNKENFSLHKELAEGLLQDLEKHLKDIC